MALSLKELNQFTPVIMVHTDHGIGRFRIGAYSEWRYYVRSSEPVFQNEDVVFVSIHSLHKVSKQQG